MTSRTLSTTAVALALLAVSAAAAPAQGLWDSRPYEVAVRVELAPGVAADGLGERLATQLSERLDARLAGFWRAQVTSGDNAASPEASLEKQITVTITGGAPLGLTAVEHDYFLGDASPPVRLTAVGVADLPERLYDAVLATFRPVAIVRRDPQAVDRVTLEYRAERLAPNRSLATAPAGHLLTAFRRRLDRNGVAESTEVVPWTYLMADPPEEGQPSAARVLSHTRRPFGIRPSARIEQLAIAAPVSPDRVTQLRLHALDNPKAPLAGYEVSLGAPGSMDLTPLGYTDSQGVVKLPPREGVWMAHVRCGGLVVASVPVAPGVADEIVIPLIDERSRLRAELEVTSLREELVDTVARRKILASRIHRLLEEESVDAAGELLDEFERLPGRTRFEQRLDSARRGAKADHPIAKGRIDRLFDTTRSLVSSSLDPRESRDLSVEIDRARQDVAIRERAESAN